MVAVEGSSNVYGSSVGAARGSDDWLQLRLSASIGRLASAARKRTGKWIPLDRTMFGVTKTLTYAAERNARACISRMSLYSSCEVSMQPLDIHLHILQH